MLANTEDAPTKKARRFFIEIIIIDNPFVRSILFIISSTEASTNEGASAILDIKRNISSITTPKHTYFN